MESWIAMKLNCVNMTDIKDAIYLGSETMQRIFNPDDSNFPFFQSFLWPQTYFRYSGCHDESHVPGRHLNALLNAEESAGITVDPVAIDNHRRAVLFSYSGSLPLPLNRNKIGGHLVNFCPHNIREGFYALSTLVKYFQTQEVIELAEKNIDCILTLWDPVAGWDSATIEKRYNLNFQKCLSFVHGLGRSLGSLVKYYSVTGSANALYLADILKDKLINEYYKPDGIYDKHLFGPHVHSVTCCLSSLAQMARLTSDMSVMNNVKAFFDNGLWRFRDQIGWSAESAVQTSTRHTDHGESNNTGDIVETALILGSCGYTKYYEDAELILRSHLLPSQLRDISFIHKSKNLDTVHNIAHRLKGSWGFPAPYGHKSIHEGREGGLCFNTDIVGGVVASLCEAYRQISYFDKFGHHVNLLFDHKTPNINIQSPYTHDSLKITLYKAGPLFVRIPSWVDHKQIKIDGSPILPVWNGNILHFQKIPEGFTIDVQFPIPERTIIMADNHIYPIRVKLKGDIVFAMDNFGAEFTYFDPIE